MLSKSFPTIATLVFVLPGLASATELDPGSVPATKHQTDALQETPEGATGRAPEARGATAAGAPVSPHQGQVLEGLDARFAYFDVDKDGWISVSEGGADPGLESQWERLDSNEDDQLDKDEFAGFEPGES
jgi:hypothetical protein